MRVSTVLAALPLAIANPIPEERTEPAPLILHERAEPAPLYLHESEADLVARGGSGKFIIKFKPDSSVASLEKTLEGIANENLAYRYDDNNFRGFTASLDRATVEGFRMIPGVEYIEQDVAGSSTGFRTQSGAPWGLGRISHRKPGSTDYVYDESAGEGVCVYITDSGIDEDNPVSINAYFAMSTVKTRLRLPSTIAISVPFLQVQVTDSPLLQEFEGRAHQIKSFVQGSNVDDLGHGTHCAGTIGSKSYGVAKKATLFGVKVISSEDQFWYSDLIAAYDFIQKDAAQRNCPNGFIVSGSLGGSYSKSLNDAANAMVDRGFFMAVAAGNNNRDTKDYSPGSAPKVCTVGGTQSDDRRYNNSNWGPAVDINGPAVGVLSTLPGGETAYYTGTSMATPHIAGLAAYLASKNGVKASPSLCKTIVDMSSKNYITNQQANTVNNIAYNGNNLA